MENKKLIISADELDIINYILESSKTVDPLTLRLINDLKQAINVAEILQSKAMPKEVVRLNSQIDLNTNFGRKVGLILVSPEEADPAQRKLSVTSGLGLAIYGRSMQEEVIWNFPLGDEKVLIEKVYGEKQRVY